MSLELDLLISTKNAKSPVTMRVMGLQINDSRISLSFKPFEIKTIRVDKIVELLRALMKQSGKKVRWNAV